MEDTIYPALHDLSFEYRVQHIPNTSPKRFKNYPLDWNFITVHNTLNENTTADDEWDQLFSPQNTSANGFHIVVDETTAIEAIPLTENVWVDGGDGETGGINRTSLNIELCIRQNSDQVINNAAELISMLLYLKGLDVFNVKQHYDWTGKNCPRALRDNSERGWSKLIALIIVKLAKLNNGIPYDLIQMDYPTKTVGGMVYININSFMAAIGGTVTSSRENLAIAVYNDKKITFTHKSSKSIGTNKELVVLQGDAEVINDNGDCYVPLSSIVHYLGGIIITWIQETLTTVVLIGSIRLVMQVGNGNMYKYAS
jgi:N-acetylmuramoyl-L-alanine amidase